MSTRHHHPDSPENRAHRGLLDHVKFDADPETVEKALLALLEEHAPAEHEARAVNSLACPDHNPRDHPGLYAATDLEFAEGCPHCTVDYYPVCSSWGCTGGWPCDTLELVTAVLDVDLDTLGGEQ